MKQIDKFFKDKLDNHVIAPPDGAWAKVEASLPKKNNVVAWRLAAAIVLMGAVITIYMSQRRTEHSVPILAAKSLKQKSKESKPVVQLTKPTEKKLMTSKTTAGIKAAPTEIQKAEQSLPTEEVVSTLKENINEEKINTQATVIAKVASPTQKPIKLEFTLEDIPSEEVVATTNEVKNSGFKKVLELAREAKQGEGPIGGLREMKNELFARNFMKGKTKNQ